MGGHKQGWARVGGLAVALVCGVGGGCAGTSTSWLSWPWSGPKVEKVTPQAFHTNAPAGVAGEDTVARSDGASAGPTTLRADAPPTSAQAVPAGGGEATAVARPAAGRGIEQPAVSLGSYYTLGGVVAEVNGTPIYAAKVLKTIEPALAARARELDADRFRAAATELLQRQIQEFVNGELLYAEAQRSLSKEDRQIADYATMQTRQRRVADAGGSQEVARRRAAEEGGDFEEEMQSEYRLKMVQLMYYKRVEPKIQVSAADMRRYYRDNVDRQFTEHEQVEFRLLRVDSRKAGSPAAALAKASDARTRAVAGEDFEAIAAAVSDDPNLKASRGKVGPMRKGAFAVSAVEAAVWGLQVGQVSEVIESGGAYYVARLESRKAGKTSTFEDPAVQDKIKRELSGQQRAKLYEQMKANLLSQSVFRTDNAMFQTVLEMAMQRYAGWRSAK